MGRVAGSVDLRRGWLPGRGGRGAMPMYRLCAEPTCPNPARPGQARCTTHYRQREAERSRRRREATSGIFKRKRWLTTRKAVPARDPICRVCGTHVSEEVDHIVPLNEGGDPWDLERLQGICRPCHQAKTARENAGA